MHDVAMQPSVKDDDKSNQIHLVTTLCVVTSPLRDIAWIPPAGVYPVLDTGPSAAGQAGMTICEYRKVLMRTDILKKSTPLTKVVIILIFIMFLPALFYSAYQYSTLGEYEELIEGVYSQQLETILFSVNQFAWDFVGSWTNKIHQALIKNDQQLLSENLAELLNDNQTIEYIIFSDTLFSKPTIFPKNTDGDILAKEINVLRDENLRIRKILKVSRLGYRRIESISAADSHAEDNNKMMLFYIQPMENQGEILVAIIIHPQIFISEVLAPKLEQIAGTQFSVGVFNIENKEVLFSNAAFSIDQINQQKKLWLFPDYLLGISLSGQSIEDLAHSRFYNSLILIGVLNLLIIIGGWILIRNIRREMQLARLKSDFVSNVSHELRTPLALIRLYAETLEMDRVKSDEKRQEYYRIINHESERLTRLINNILNFSRIDSGRKEYKFSAVDINQVTKSVLEMYSYHIDQEGFVLNTELDKQIPLILADPESVSEALINLIDNAVKYSQDEKEIVVRTGLSDGSVFLEVQDKGIGIDQKQQEVIFDKFYRISSALVHDTKGSGLGLSLIKHIMKSHGGNIRVQSEVGKGSTFRLLFHISKTEG